MGAFLVSLLRGAAPKAVRPALAGGLGFGKRVFPRATGTPKPSLSTRVGAGVQEGLQRFSGTRTGQALQAAGAAPVRNWATQAASRTPAAHRARAEAVGALPRAISYLGYAAPGLAVTEGVRRGYNAYRDRSLPSLEEVVPNVPSREDRIQQAIDQYNEIIVNPQMDALNRWVDGGWESERRQQAENLIRQMGDFGDASARGIEDSYGQYVADQEAQLAAIENIASASEPVFDEDTEATRAAVAAELYGGEGETSGLVPVSGDMADMPGRFADESDISAREALASILGESSGARFGAQTGERYGQAYADELRNAIALEQFGTRAASDASIAAERERREEQRLMAQLGLESERGQFQLGLEQARLAESADEDDALRALLSNQDEVRRLQRVWRDLVDPSPLRVGPLGNRAARQLALYQSLGINTFEDFIRAVATNEIVA